MNFPTPIPTTTLAYAAIGAGVLTIVAYVLKIRRRRFEVPFSMLWQRVLEQRDANALWKQLKRLLSLLLMFVLLGLLFFAALDPTDGGRPPQARTVVVLIDASASMKATDGEGDTGNVTRMEVAKRHARALVDSMGGADVAMIMKVDGQATPLSRFHADAALHGRTIDAIQASDTPADLYRALGAASDALRGRQNPLLVLISDGAYTDQQLAAATFDPPTDAGAAAPVAPPPGAAPGTAGAPAAPPVDTGDADADAEIKRRRQAYEGKNLAAVDLSGIDVRYIPVGTRADNVGIIAFNVRRYVANKAAYEVFIEVQNFGTEAARRQLTLYSGDTAIDVQPIEIPAGQKVRKIYRELSGGTDHRLRASLRPVDGPGGSDPFGLDDEAFALLPERKRQKVLLVTEDNLFLEGAMLVYDNIEVFKLTPAEYDAGPAAASADMNIVVFDEHTPAELPPPPAHAMYFHPAPERSPIPVTKTVDRPRITEVAEEHPVMRWVTLSDVNFTDAHAFKVDRARGEAWLAQAVRDVVIAARRDQGRKILVFGFSLAGTDLPMRVAFPLMLVNAIDWFAGDDADLMTTYVTGQRLKVPLDGVAGVTDAVVVRPDGTMTWAPVADGVASFYGTRIGFHDIRAYAPPEAAGDDAGNPRPRDHTTFPADDEAPIAEREIAANLGSPEESDIAPASTLTLGGAGGKTLEAPGTFTKSIQRRFWTLLLLGLLALLAVEWITYHRRITV